MKRAHIIPMAGGDEYDALTLWRHVLRWKPGTRKVIKRSTAEGSGQREGRIFLRVWLSR
jgi:hypothetical protein